MKQKMLNQIQHDKQGRDDRRQGKIQDDNKEAKIWVDL
jgi:hypothetical protein